jgi:hypothetical protein
MVLEHLQELGDSTIDTQTCSMPDIQHPYSTHSLTRTALPSTWANLWFNFRNP